MIYGIVKYVCKPNLLVLYRFATSNQVSSFCSFSKSSGNVHPYHQNSLTRVTKNLVEASSPPTADRNKPSEVIKSCRSSSIRSQSSSRQSVDKIRNRCQTSRQVKVEGSVQRLMTSAQSRTSTDGISLSSDVRLRSPISDSFQENSAGKQANLLKTQHNNNHNHIKDGNKTAEKVCAANIGPGTISQFLSRAKTESVLKNYKEGQPSVQPQRARSCLMRRSKIQEQNTT